MRVVHAKTGELVLMCAVPFCDRTTRKWLDSSEMICADHWRMISVFKRQAWALAKRRKASRETLATIWKGLKREAIEVAAGIRR